MNLSAMLNAVLRHGPWGLVAWIGWMAWLFAKLEIQIEGAHGWAANLPTWRVQLPPSLRWLFGGRDMTGYHVYAFAFMAAAFHLPLVMVGEFSLVLEARALGGLALFWILEDFLWFVLNPAYGLRRFRPEHVPWHPHWFLGLPVDYFVMGACALALLAYASWPPGGYPA
jgi:hypothetical protein